MTTIRFERDGAIGNIVLANPPFNRLDLRFAEALRVAVHQASESDIRVLVVRSEGPHFSFGGEVREWPGKDVNWFRTFVADVNVSYGAIETLKITTVAVVQGISFGGGFELALACDFLVVAENATLRCVEVTTAMLPVAGALQRIAERAGRPRAAPLAPRPPRRAARPPAPSGGPRGARPAPARRVPPGSASRSPDATPSRSASP